MTASRTELTAGLRLLGGAGVAWTWAIITSYSFFSTNGGASADKGVEDAADGIDIDTGVEGGGAAKDFRRGVGGAADDGPGASDAGVIRGFGGAKAGEFDQIFRGNEDVRRGDFAMDDADGMRGVDGGEDLKDRPNGIFDGHGGEFEAVSQGDGFKRFDGDCEMPADFEDAMASEYIRVIQRDEDAAFAVEAGGAFGIVAKGIGQDLDLLDAMVRDVSSAKRYSFGGTIEIVQQLVPVHDLSDGERHALSSSVYRPFWLGALDLKQTRYFSGRVLLEVWRVGMAHVDVLIAVP